MKVRVCKTVDLDLEVDVDIDDIVTEFGMRAGDAEIDSKLADGRQTYSRSLLSGLDAITRIMSRIPQEAIDAFSDEACKILSERLAAQASRFGPTG